MKIEIDVNDELMARLMILSLVHGCESVSEYCSEMVRHQTSQIDLNQLLLAESEDVIEFARRMVEGYVWSSLLARYQSNGKRSLLSLSQSDRDEIDRVIEPLEQLFETVSIHSGESFATHKNRL